MVGPTGSKASWTALLATGATLAGSCLPPASHDHPAVRIGALASLVITVSETELPLASDACFDVTVYATDDPAELGPSTEAWSATGLCASTHGGPGLSLDLVAACDPSAPGAEHGNTVRLTLNALYTGGAAGAGGVEVAPDFYVNPCPAETDDCLLAVACTDESPASVHFGLAVVAQADVGLHDAAVYLGEVRCVARLDCEDVGGAPLDPLAPPGGDGAGPTVGLRLACHPGPTAEEHTIYLTDVVVSCENGWVAAVDPAAAPGWVVPDDPAGVLFGAAVHRGEGALRSLYWNVLLGVRLASLSGAGVCTLTAVGASSPEPLCETPAASRFPLILWEVPLTEGAAQVCGRHDLVDGAPGVTLGYTPLAVPFAFVHRLRSGAQGVVERLAEGCAPD